MTLAELEAAHPGFKEFCRESFIGNECGSDEYGETQPAKGMSMIAGWLESLHPDRPDPATFAEIAQWMLACVRGGRYDGADELVPVLERYFEFLWGANEHPYSDVEEIDQYELQWFLESQSQA